MEPGDGELVVPAVLQALCEFPSPQGVLGAGGALQSDSCFRSSTLSLAGANVAADTDLLLFTKGLWHFTCFAQFAFRGTDSIGQRSGLMLIDQNANAIPIFLFPHLSAMALSSSQEFWLVVPTDTYKFQTRQQTMVAGDILGLSTTVIANRML